MSDASIVVIGVPAVMEALHEFPRTARNVYREASIASMYHLIGVVARYPSPPPSSTYRRTGLLGRNWNVKTTEFAAGSNWFRATLRNKTPYAEYVQGERQARIHRKRWTTIRDAAQQKRGVIEAEFERAIKRLASAIARGEAS